MRVRLLVLQQLSILLDWGTAKEHSSLDVRHVLGETVVLVTNLESQFTSVAHDEDGALPSHRLDLLEGGENENGRLSETGLGLADDISSQHGLRNTCLLDCAVDRC